MTTLSLVQDVHAGREAFARDLERALKGASPAERGWAVPNDLTLLAPFFCERADGSIDFFLLRLLFDHYASAPPSACFVNPATLSYSHPADMAWVPRIEGHSSIGFHPSYSGGGQLICSSTTLEFYQVNHGVEDKHRWRPGEMTFMTTLAAIKSGLAKPYYIGRAG